MSTNDSTCLGDSHGSIKNTLAAKPELSYADLDGETIISKGRAYQCFRDNIDRYILLPGLKVKILGETADESIITELVAQNHAINIGYDYAAVLNTHEDIVLRPLSEGTEKGQSVYLITDKYTLPTTASKKFRQFILDWLPASGKHIVIPSCFPSALPIFSTISLASSLITHCKVF
ncbi:LysR family transcriptional regulator substrate-binding protein [Selenomonas ruminantium]|nr:LysR family transcriptional regulator substrate-binding protein [Selenomonas ruminantium]